MTISKSDLLKARVIAAQVVRQLGDRYWPIFEVLDQEMVERKQRESRLIECLKPPNIQDGPHQTS
jgi:hypothetical protein